MTRVARGPGGLFPPPRVTVFFRRRRGELDGVLARWSSDALARGSDVLFSCETLDLPDASAADDDAPGWALAPSGRCVGTHRRARRGLVRFVRPSPACAAGK